MLIISASYEVEGIDKRSSAVLESCQSVSVRRPSFGRPKPALGPARQPELMALPGRTPPVGRATGRSERLWWVGKKKRDNDRDEEAMLESWSPSLHGQTRFTLGKKSDDSAILNGEGFAT
jgi:hypothetical protein